MPSRKVVAVEITRQPRAFTSASSAGAGRPKWKLTTAGRNSSSSGRCSGPNGARPVPSVTTEGSTPYSAKYGASAARHAASRAASGAGARWQKKLTLNGRPAAPARSAASSARSDSGVSIAAGSDPSAPLWQAATASAAPCTPAIGAWTIGHSVPSSAASRFIEEVSAGVARDGACGPPARGARRRRAVPCSSIPRGRRVDGASPAGRVSASGAVPPASPRPSRGLPA